MPFLKIQTNIKLEKVQKDDFLAHCSQSVAEMLSKPEPYVMVLVADEMSLSFAGNDKPAAYLELKSLGLPSQKTPAFSETLCNLVHQALGIAPDRIYIEFSAPERSHWGWDSHTF